MKKFHLRAPNNRRYHRTIFTVSKISEPTNTAQQSSSTPPFKATPGKKKKKSLTPAPETLAPKPREGTSTKRNLFETTGEGISETKKQRSRFAPTIKTTNVLTRLAVTVDTVVIMQTQYIFLKTKPLHTIPKQVHSSRARVKTT
ncbi:hypothetical protein L1987_01249 [Smallanthus sonchifolius]|uniref:Uncharacterized protein n=1 Tax=Smallanthus sonchifolius TaxID=185202 RepID=A0ACB9K4J9_9ASTR|nr:hypothetical protein L1987_01249 [Smallanthus sonchifolius]